MAISTMQKVVITAGAVITVLGTTYGVTSLVEDTPFGVNASVVDCKFKYFIHKHGEDLRDDKNFQAVLAFFKKPYGAKLIATPANVEGKVTYTYEYIEKGDKGTADTWKNMKANKETLKATKADWKANNVLQDWEAVNQFMKDWKAKHSITEKSSDDVSAPVVLEQPQNPGKGQ